MYAPVNPFVAISHLIFSGIASIVLAIEIIPFLKLLTCQCEAPRKLKASSACH